eukprot:c46152_g1_i1.p1 GENE.c46152_g1_i1~~c46152_g1_i1.p1  ORF type:complete len:307 (-),score=63.58 c46152_g1_i1:201-1121(-)
MGGRVHQGGVFGFFVTWKAAIKLLKYDDIPVWAQQNELIRTCYRCEMNAVEALKSIFQIHCETGNIWTHLIPGIVSLVLGFGYALDQSICALDRAALGTFFFGSTCCYLCSATYHTLHICSPESSIAFGQLDFVGIVLGIWGGETGAIIALFPCEHHKMWLFELALTIFGIIALMVVIIPRFNSNTYRGTRSLIFVAFGLSGLLPFFVFIWDHLACSNHHACSVALTQVVSNAIFCASAFLFGACLYNFRFPERYFPERFDLFGQSHQIWHLLVVLGFWFNLQALWALIHFRHVALQDCDVEKGFW